MICCEVLGCCVEDRTKLWRETLFTGLATSPPSPNVMNYRKDGGLLTKQAFSTGWQALPSLIKSRVWPSRRDSKESSEFKYGCRIKMSCSCHPLKVHQAQGLPPAWSGSGSRFPLLYSILLFYSSLPTFMSTLLVGLTQLLPSILETFLRVYSVLIWWLHAVAAHL